jgi:Ni,Fe-hydrogenase I small subunit
MYGGTSSQYPSGSILGSGSTIADGTILLDSYDRYDLEHTTAHSHATISWTPSIATGGMILNTSDSAGVIIGAPGRTLSGQVRLNAPSFLAEDYTYLQALTKVEAEADRLSIDPTLEVFGYVTSTTDELELALPYSDDDYVLNGDITLPAPPAVASGVLGYTAMADAVDKTMLNEARLFATSAAAVLCVGTCSSFGGIPAANGNKTGAAGALYKGRRKPGDYNGAMTEFASKTVNISGCPPHSDWIVGTIAYLLATNLSEFPPLESYARPIDFYGEYQCNAGPCEWRYNQGYVASDETNYYVQRSLPTNATINSSKLYKWKWANDADNNDKRNLGCIGVLGCKGRKTKADCSLRRWNADAAKQYGSGWCVSSGAGCHGCTEPAFPDKVGKFFNFA